MKKIIIMITILLTISISILGLAFFKTKLNKEYELVEFDSYIVDLVDNKAVNDIEYKNIKITDINIEQKVLNFNVICNKEEIKDKTITITLYNDFAASPGNVIDYRVSDLKDEIKEIDNGYNLNLNISDYYNNPYRIRIEIR